MIEPVNELPKLPQARLYLRSAQWGFDELLAKRFEGDIHPERKGFGHILESLTYADMTPGRTLRVSLAGRGALLSQGWLSRD
jgi:hypothetical protein